MVSSGYGFCQTKPRPPITFSAASRRIGTWSRFTCFVSDSGARQHDYRRGLRGAGVRADQVHLSQPHRAAARADPHTCDRLGDSHAVALLAALPAHHPVLLYASLSFIAYYLIASFILHARAAMNLRRYRRGA